MIERKFIKPNIFRITQTVLSIPRTEIQEVFYARFKGSWYRINDDKIETAIALVKGKKPKYATQLTQGQETDLKTRHLDHSENSEENVQW